MIRDLKEGDIVYVRAEFRQWIDGTDAAQVYIRHPDRLSFQSAPVPRVQLVEVEQSPRK